MDERSVSEELSGGERHAIIVDARPLMPSGVHEMLEASRDEGIENVSHLVRQWNDGSVRFDAAGETLLMVQAEGANVGIGGLRQCKDVPGALRVSRFYVLPAWRRRGVATMLASEVLRVSERFANRVTCNAQASDAAGEFWESLGFSPVARSGITHIREFSLRT